MKQLFALLVLSLFIYSNDAQSACSDCSPYGSCVDKNDDGSCAHCICPKDFSGDCCETEPNACTLNPCSTVASEYWECTDLGAGQRECKCQAGFTGDECDTDADSCDAMKCYNGGICNDDPINGTHCNCNTNFSGDFCETYLTTSCSSGNPCQNGGTCFVKNDNNKYCDCPFGYTGTNCETKICGSLVCQHGGKCVADSSGTETCDCLDIWKGINCETFESCNYWNCDNGGTCYSNSSDNIPKCSCVNGWQGKHCEIMTDNCSPNPCIYTNAGVSQTAPCTNQVADYSCSCPSGTSGKNCSDNHDDCQTNGSNNICTSVDKTAACADGLDEYTCTCSSAAYFGDECETYNACFNVTCDNGGTCSTVNDKFKCDCQPGYVGDRCQTYDACFNVTCLNGGTCSTVNNVFKCACVKGYEGDTCQTVTDNCSPNPCIYTNAGVSQTAPCTNQVADYSCTCPSGTSGKNCSDNHDDCQTNGSNNICTSVDKSATCADGLDEYTCTCSAAYYGDKCETYNACFNVTCANGGTCSTVNGKYSCACVEGYTGDKCQTIIDNCNPNPCNYTEYGFIKQATCKNKVADFDCSCPSGTSGKTCNGNPDDCQRSGKGLQDNLCNTVDKSANCSDGLNAYKCSCSAAYSGIDCKTYNACYNVVCKNGGMCSTVDNQFSLCTCVKGYEGTLCETITNNCDPNPCIYEEWGVHKEATCTNKVADWTCSCPSGTSGKNCSTNADDCKWNGAHTVNICNTVDKDATCWDGLNNYTCTCGAAYVGPQCKTYNACFNVTCANSGNCSTVTNTKNFKCSCVRGYEGQLCETVTDNCNPNPCVYTEFGTKNEAPCTNAIGDYSCSCPSGSSGKNCTDNADDCKKSGPNNVCTAVDKKATCSDGLDEFRCTCSAAYKGDLCTIYDACFNVTCANGGTCTTVNNKFNCNCPIGWENDKCQTMTNNCNPNPCVYTEYGVKKTATCTNKLADYDCSCPVGTSGKNCENNFDDCLWDDSNTINICNTADAAATCSDGLDKYKCTCGPAYKGDQCTIYNACFNVTCLNGATCSTVDMQPVCTCAKGYEGTLCETITNNCKPNPCIYEEWGVEKEATCTNKIADYTCTCPSGTSGKNCSTNPDDCKSTPSGGNICNKVDVNATCLDGLNNYTCSCSPDYKGNQCQTYDACVFNHCDNGNCSTVGHDFLCNCTKGWEGRHCETMTDNCSPNPCIYEEWGVKNETTCTNMLADYLCECPLGTSGKNCSINFDDCKRSGKGLLDNVCNSVDTGAKCADGLNEYRCTCSAEYTGPQCKMTVIVWKVAQLFGGIDDIINLLEEVVKTPSLIKDLVPFLLGQQPRDNQSAMSWDFEELFEWASYEENELDYLKDFTLTFDTTLGNCYTFNNGNCSRRWSSRKSGQDGGFRAKMRVRQNQYLAWIDTASLLVFVHPPEESVFAESVRYQIAPNTSASIITQRNAYSRLSGKYGTCVKDKGEVESYYYSGNYTTAGCFRGCYQDAVYEECGCMDPRYAMPEDMSACNMSVWNCVKSITDIRGDASNWKDCKCPSPCSESQFDSAYAKASFPSYYFGCDYVKGDPIKYKYCMGNYTDSVFVSVYVPKLTRKVFAEVPAMSLTQFLSNVGGIAGLFIGFSVVTIFDFAFLFIWLGRALCMKDPAKDN